MKPEEINALAAIAQAVLALATLIVSIVISLFVYYGTRKIARLEHDRSIREWWNTLNTIALDDDKMLEIAEKLMNPSASPQTAEETRRKWFAFVVLNTLSSSYLGAMTGVSRSSEETINIVKHHLRKLLSSEDIFNLTQGEGYEKDFANLCRQIRAEISSQHSAELQEEAGGTKLTTSATDAKSKTFTKSDTIIED